MQILVRISIQKPRQRGKKFPIKEKLARMSEDQRKAFAARQKEKIAAMERHMEAKKQQLLRRTHPFKS